MLRPAIQATWVSNPPLPQAAAGDVLPGVAHPAAVPHRAGHAEVVVAGQVVQPGARAKGIGNVGTGHIGLGRDFKRGRTRVRLTQYRSSPHRAHAQDLLACRYRGPVPVLVGHAPYRQEVAAGALRSRGHRLHPQGRTRRAALPRERQAHSRDGCPRTLMPRRGHPKAAPADGRARLRAGRMPRPSPRSPSAASVRRRPADCSPGRVPSGGWLPGWHPARQCWMSLPVRSRLLRPAPALAPAPAPNGPRDVPVSRAAGLEAAWAGQVGCSRRQQARRPHASQSPAVRASPLLQLRGDAERNRLWPSAADFQADR